MESNLCHFIKGCVFVILVEWHLHNFLKRFSRVQGHAEHEKIFVLLAPCVGI